MKKLVLLSAIVIGGLVNNTAKAQIGIHLGFHFGQRRVYAPAPVVVEDQPVYQESAPVSYDDDYYYLPDVGAYYSVGEQCYYYNDGGNWISAAYLPGYRNYDWRSARHYEIRSARPYMNNEFYRSRYGGFQGGGNRFHSEGYANADRYNHNGYRDQQQRFDNRGFENKQRFDNHQYSNNQRFNGNQGGYRQNNQMQSRGQNNGWNNQNHGFDKGNQPQNNGNYASHNVDRGNGGQRNLQNNERSYNGGGNYRRGRF